MPRACFGLVGLALALAAAVAGALAMTAPPSRSRGVPLAQRIGVSVIGHGGSACLSVPDPGLRPGRVLELISPAPPRRDIRAVVLGRGRACPGWHGAGIAGYRLRLEPRRHALGAPPGLVLFALPGAAGFRRAAGGAVGRLTRHGRLLRLAACTSADGVHLTVWRGAAPGGRRLLHIYYYLDQDLVPDCGAAETAAPVAATH